MPWAPTLMLRMRPPTRLRMVNVRAPDAPSLDRRPGTLASDTLICPDAGGRRLFSSASVNTPALLAAGPAFPFERVLGSSASASTTLPAPDASQT